MKYSQQIGMFCALLLIATCFFTWIQIPQTGLLVSGFSTKGTSFGRPGILMSFFAVSMFIMFAINRIWAKRVNVFLGALNVSWGIRNFILYSSCWGLCPERKPGLWLMLALCSIILLMSLLPKIDVSNRKS